MDHNEARKRVNALLDDLRGPLVRHTEGLSNVDAMTVTSEALALIFAVEVLVHGKASPSDPDLVGTAARIIRSFPWESSIKLAATMIADVMQREQRH